jgi:hypothetical protein
MKFGEGKHEKITIRSAEEAASYLASQDFIRRRIYPSAVENYVGELEEDGTFLVESTCNTWNGHPYVIDGQHRMFAIQKWFEKGNVKPISIPACVYHGLDIDKMRALYAKLSMQKPQSPEDKILVNTQGTKIYNMLAKQLPLDVGLDIQTTVFMQGY